MANKVIIKISFSTFLISGILLNLYFYLKYGADYLHTEDLMVGIPLWTLLSTYAVYGGANYYYKQKQLFIPDNHKIDSKSIKEWSEYRLYLLSRFMRILALMFSMAFPVYLLAYLDHSKEIHSGPVKIITFLLLAIGCGICSRILKRRYTKHLQG